MRSTKTFSFSRSAGNRMRWSPIRRRNTPLHSSPFGAFTFRSNDVNLFRVGGVDTEEVVFVGDLVDQRFVDESSMLIEQAE
jgi:hypothetical protein